MTADTVTLKKPKVKIFTDGGCRGNPGIGGWGAVLIAAKHRKEIQGSAWQTTNNRMELTAAIEAISLLNQACQIELWTDSSYVKNGITQWLPKWLQNNWRTASKKTVKNQDLWQALIEVSLRHEINWHWLKGHAGHPENERADALANLAMDALISQSIVER